MAEKYRDILADLFKRSATGMKFGLDTTRTLLSALGEPQTRLRHIVVAGTNGKGTVSRMIAHGLQLAGLRVGLFTSPHLLRFSERFLIDGEELPEETIAALYQRLRQAEKACPTPPTFFECATAMAECAFADAGVDVAVLEVGLGGRLDATNVVDKILSVITPIDFDHMQYLGDTLEGIAGEKAGILAPGGLSVIAPQTSAAHDAIADVAAERQTELIDSASVSLKDGRLFIGEDLVFDDPPPGRHQHHNIATAVTALRVLARRGIHCDTPTIHRAITTVEWPGRYQWIDDSPPILLDCAHNVAGARALADALGRDRRIRGRPIHAVFSASADKDIEAMLDTLGPRLSSLAVAPMQHPRGATAERLLEAAGHIYLDDGPDAFDGFADAFAGQKRRAAEDGGMVLITGSLFFIADALAHITGAKRDPPVIG